VGSPWRRLYSPRIMSDEPMPLADAAGSWPRGRPRRVPRWNQLLRTRHQPPRIEGVEVLPYDICFGDPAQRSSDPVQTGPTQPAGRAGCALAPATDPATRGDRSGLMGGAARELLWSPPRRSRPRCSGRRRRGFYGGRAVLHGVVLVVYLCMPLRQQEAVGGVLGVASRWDGDVGLVGVSSGTPGAGAHIARVSLVGREHQRVELADAAARGPSRHGPGSSPSEDAVLETEAVRRLERVGDTERRRYPPT